MSTPAPTKPPITLGYCGTCKFYGTVLSACRLNPPLVLQGTLTTPTGGSTSYPTIESYWPPVDPNVDWCGQWIAA